MCMTNFLSDIFHRILCILLESCFENEFHFRTAVI
jgi:hypothetical protein